MTKSSKKAGGEPRQRNRTPDSGAIAAPVRKPEPTYININRHQAELAAKNKLLWIIVAVFIVILSVFWLLLLRLNIQKATADAGFSQIGQQIRDSLARFDTEIKNRSAAKAISADDLAAIRTNLEEQIKRNPDSSLWPTRELPHLGISLQTPNDWKVSGGIISRGLPDDFDPRSDSISPNAAIINIQRLRNDKALPLRNWLEVSGAYQSNQTADLKSFNTATSTIEGLIIFSSSTATALHKTIYLGYPKGKAIWEFTIDADGDIALYEPIAEEIIRTIKIIK